MKRLDYQFNLLTMGNPKLMKGLKKTWLPLCLMMSPAKRSGYEVCPYRTVGCTRLCLNTAGKGGMGVKQQGAEKLVNKIQLARIRRTHLFFEERETFWLRLIDEIRLAQQLAKEWQYSTSKAGHAYFTKRKTMPAMQLCIRLNGTSDIAWERIPVEYYGQRYPNIMYVFPEIQFYDYTKIPRRFRPPGNYSLLFSQSEDPRSIEWSEDYYKHGVNTAVVFSTARGWDLPHEYRGRRVLDADMDDLRFLDPPNVIAGLRAKGLAREPWAVQNGFVVDASMLGNPPGAKIALKDFDGGNLFPDFDDLFGHVEWSKE